MASAGRSSRSAASRCCRAGSSASCATIDHCRLDAGRRSDRRRLPRRVQACPNLFRYGCSPRARSPAAFRARCSPRRIAGRRAATPRWCSRAMRMPALLMILVPFSLSSVVLAMPAVIWVMAPGLHRRSGDLRQGGQLRLHHLPLSRVHLARLALWRRAGEQHRPLRRSRLHAPENPAQHHPDRLRAQGLTCRSCCRTPVTAAMIGVAMASLLQWLWLLFSSLSATAISMKLVRPLHRRACASWSSSPRRWRSAAARSRSAACSTSSGPRCCPPARSRRSTMPTASASCRWP